MRLLKPHHIHVWTAVRKTDYFPDEHDGALLNSFEKDRAQRFKFENDRLDFIFAHTQLKKILAEYLNCAAQDLNIQITPQGKPFLVDYPELQFNYSHADNLVLYAVTRDDPIGVDVELTNRSLDCLSIAKRFFTAYEFKILEKILDPESQKSLFLKIWTHKEALLKCIGSGLSESLNKIEFEVNADDSLQLKYFLNESEKLNDWFFKDLTPTENSIGAIAIQRKENFIEQFEWNTL